MKLRALNGEIFIYRIKRDGLELLLNVADDWTSNGLKKVNDKWIYTNSFRYGEGWNFLYGYYLYENDDFKYIERFATGEKISDENGNYPKGFQELVFEPNGIFVTPFESGNLEEESKFHILSRGNSELFGEVYSIKILEDTYTTRFIGSQGETDETYELKSGTVLEDVRIWHDW